MATYTVSRGDTLTSIAQRFGVSPVEIAQANGIQDPNLIEVGQVLTLPESGSAPGEAVTQGLLNDPEAGDKWGQLFGPPTEEEIQQADLMETGPAKQAMGDVPAENVPGFEAAQAEARDVTTKSVVAGQAESAEQQQALQEAMPGLTAGGPMNVMEQTLEARGDQPFALPPAEQEPVEAAPAVSAEKAATEVAAVEPEAPPTEELTIDQAVELNPQLKDSINAYRQFATDFLALEPADVTITKDQIKAMDQQITGYNNRIQAIAEERAKPFFGKEDTGRKFLAAIAAGLGAYAAAMTGTRNFALDTINAAIEQDLQQQQQNKEFRLRDLEGQRTLLLERRGELLQYAQNLISSNVQLAKDQGMVAGNLAQLDQAQQRIEQDKIKTQQDLQLAVAKAQAAAITKVTELTVPGVGIARSQADKKTYLEFYTAKETLSSRIDEILNLIKESGVEKYVPTSTVNTKLSSLLSEIQGNYKNRVANTGAATTVQEMNRFITKVAPDWTIGSQLGEIVGSTVTTRLQALKSALEEDDRMLKGLYILGGPEKQAKKEGSGIPGAEAGVR